jgi:hypothetical protein
MLLIIRGRKQKFIWISKNVHNIKLIIHMSSVNIIIGIFLLCRLRLFHLSPTTPMTVTYKAMSYIIFNYIGFFFHPSCRSVVYLALAESLIWATVPSRGLPTSVLLNLMPHQSRAFQRLYRVGPPMHYTGITFTMQPLECSHCCTALRQQANIV